MKRFDITTAGDLGMNDIFYRLNDRTKTPHQVTGYEPTKTQYQTYSIKCKKVNHRQEQFIKNSTPVVYLRNLADK